MPRSKQAAMAGAFRYLCRTITVGLDFMASQCATGMRAGRTDASHHRQLGQVCGRSVSHAAFMAPLMLLVLLVSGCGDEYTPPSQVANPSQLPNGWWQPAPNTEWPTSPAQAEGFDSEILSRAFADGHGISSSYALLVLRNGQLVGEGYYHGKSSQSLLQLRSVTKTVVMLLVGHALQRGELRSLQQDIVPLLPAKYRSQAQAWRGITLADLLSMSSGVAWDESVASRYNSWAQAPDPTALLLQQPMSHAPGLVFNYNSAASHLLSLILTEQTGKSLAEYANLTLFQGLGIRQFRWETLGDGYTNGSAGLELRARDLAKLLQLTLNDGRWQGQTWVPEYFIRQARDVAMQFERQYAQVEIRGYGHLWWLVRADDHAMQLAWGYGGQFVLTDPARQLLVLSLHEHQTNNVNAQEYAAMGWLVNKVLPALP